ncbi:MAG: hypothetical protein NPIRA05_07030 [Nitrospirales bacterium]|nr:MAG: hypothetical protein NPIRA05_07030 [Nitrospirales bacterium]
MRECTIFGAMIGESSSKGYNSYILQLPSGKEPVRDRLFVRMFFYVSGAEMVLFHGLVKKSQKTPDKELILANKRKKEHDRYETGKI